MHLSRPALKWTRFPALLFAGIVNALGVTIFLYPVNLYDSGISGTWSTRPTPPPMSPSARWRTLSK